jgi:hypothetical protein
MPAGPVDVVIVEFPENAVRGELVNVLADLVSAEDVEQVGTGLADGSTAAQKARLLGQ